MEHIEEEAIVEAILLKRTFGTEEIHHLNTCQQCNDLVRQSAADLMRKWAKEMDKTTSAVEGCSDYSLMTGYVLGVNQKASWVYSHIAVCANCEANSKIIKRFYEGLVKSLLGNVDDLIINQLRTKLSQI